MAAFGLKARKVVVMGANASGVALIRFLVRKGATAKLVDSRARDVLEAALAEQLDLSKFELEAGEATSKTFEGAETIIVTPGLPLDTKVLEGARTAGIQVVSELEFASLFVEEPLIAVAGTNGKSTTAHLLNAIFAADGKAVFANVLQPLAAYLNQAKPSDFVVTTASSFQLEGTTNFKARGIVLTNISEDSANRYPNFETYLAANREVLKNADQETITVLNVKDANIMSFAGMIPGRTLAVSSDPLPEGFEGGWYTRTHLHLRLRDQEHSFDLTNFRLRGAHNKENLLGAALMALVFGVKADAIKKVIENVRTLPHRTEFVRRINSVAFYDDSSSANPMSVLRTLQAFNEPVILISGGRDKNADYTPLIPHIRQRVKNLILVGEAKEKINRAIGDFTETFLVGTVEEAIILAYQKSRSGDVVLFSPGCDPGDMFASVEDKGEYFKKLVTQIAQPRRPNVF